MLTVPTHNIMKSSPLFHLQNKLKEVFYFAEPVRDIHHKD